MAIVPAAVSALLTITGPESRNTTFELSPAGLRMRGNLCRREIPHRQRRGRAGGGLSQRARSVAEVAPFQHRAALLQRRLVPARQRRKCAGLSDAGDRAVYLRTTDGDSLLLSVQEPEQLLAELRERAPRPWSAREPAGMADTGIWGMLAGASTQTPACA